MNLSGRLFCLFILLLVLGLAPRAWTAGTNPPSHLAAAEVMRCLGILEHPSLDNAVAATKELRQLADRQQGPARAATEKLITEIRNLFYSELVLTKAKADIPAAHQRAHSKEQAAAAWLRPNAFGTINRVAHRNEMIEAEQIRTSAEAAVTQAAQGLRDVLGATRTALVGYGNAGQVEVRGSLERAARAVINRSLHDYTLTLPIVHAPTAPALPVVPQKPELDPATISLLVGGAVMVLILYFHMTRLPA